MSFDAKMKVDGTTFRVLRCNYQLERDTSRTGVPTNKLRGGKITVSLESSTSTFFFDWVINQYATKNGEIQFTKRNDPEAPAKVLKFEEAYLVEYGEDFNVSGGGEREQPMVETFVLSARDITMDPGGTFKNDWSTDGGA